MKFGNLVLKSLTRQMLFEWDLWIWRIVMVSVRSFDETVWSTAAFAMRSSMYQFVYCILNYIDFVAIQVELIEDSERYPLDE